MRILSDDRVVRVPKLIGSFEIGKGTLIHLINALSGISLMITIVKALDWSAYASFSVALAIQTIAVLIASAGLPNIVVKLMANFKIDTVGGEYLYIRKTLFRWIGITTLTSLLLISLIPDFLDSRQKIVILIVSIAVGSLNKLSLALLTHPTLFNRFFRISLSKALLFPTVAYFVAKINLPMVTTIAVVESITFLYLELTLFKLQPNFSRNVKDTRIHKKDALVALSVIIMNEITFKLDIIVAYFFLEKSIAGQFALIANASESFLGLLFSVRNQITAQFRIETSNLNLVREANLVRFHKLIAILLLTGTFLLSILLISLGSNPIEWLIPFSLLMTNGLILIRPILFGNIFYQYGNTKIHFTINLIHLLLGLFWTIFLTNIYGVAGTCLGVLFSGITFRSIFNYSLKKMAAPL